MYHYFGLICSIIFHRSVSAETERGLAGLVHTDVLYYESDNESAAGNVHSAPYRP